ncbi:MULTISPECIES: hypothetical protein [unclassified Bradyrhizobium]|uniref:hypothetical protein n=1 Tax=unclassified Bradyrhizobium TaxID=2631580 RepID=UPI0020B37021|nr:MULTISPECIES: hypothetical protein [unclassified Bradyrhizobium]MCP3380014.1 hypothetical protein [Bradyrhizobium sp. CCGUVB4N]MCP3440851.1 hypothetical protein [Bradyrhizobium sp. CCGUVB14]
MIIGIHAFHSAGNLRATLLEHRHRFPDVDPHLVDGTRDQLISDLINSARILLTLPGPDVRMMSPT